jgi:hypothetical protein
MIFFVSFVQTRKKLYRMHGIKPEQNNKEGRIMSDKIICTEFSLDIIRCFVNISRTQAQKVVTLKQILWIKGFLSNGVDYFFFFFQL